MPQKRVPPEILHQFSRLRLAAADPSSYESMLNSAELSRSSPLRMLVVIASYGTRNDQYLIQLVRQYQSMPYQTHIVVLSNLAKDAGKGVEVQVGLPDEKDPWSLPFSHKAIFASRSNDYDLFVYSEDDTLISERNIRWFLELTTSLPKSKIAGFLRKEVDSDGRTYYPDVHHNFHWDPMSVTKETGHTTASFSNEHAACYLMTRNHLEHAIASGGFLVPPHQEKYDLLCTAATDPYTQCGLRKVIGISRWDDCLVHHLPNKYIGTLGIADCEMQPQLAAMMEMAASGATSRALVATEPRLKGWRLAKDYYEPARTNAASLIPAPARRVLSVGCCWGATEERLAKAGKEVSAIPMDPIIGACARARNVQILQCDLTAALRDLMETKAQFDCVLLLDILHLVPEPQTFLHSFASVMAPGATAVISVPNLNAIRIRWKKLTGSLEYRGAGRYDLSGVHAISLAQIRDWCAQAGFRATRFVPAPAPQTAESGFRRFVPLRSRSSILALAEHFN